MTLSEAVFCIGSNCGDREENVASNLVWLSRMLTGFRHSPIYSTPDCHGGTRKYMNAIGIGFTHMLPHELEQMCKERELACGRDASARAAGDVPMDIDLVVYGGEILRDKDYRSEFFLQGYLALNHAHSPSEI